MRVAKYYGWEEDKKEENKQIRKEIGREQEKVDSDILTRSMMKKGVTFAENYLIKEEKDRKYDVMMKYNYVEVKEEDEYLSSVLVMEVKDRNSE